MDKKIIKLTSLCLLFSVAIFFVYNINQEDPIRHKSLLADYFDKIPGYTLAQQNQLSNETSSMLKLDDYIFTDYSTAQAQVNLYIGYYYSANKAYAAHSPLICYPSQGWLVERQPITRQLDAGSHTIRYEEIITSYGDKKELVIYWYQARLNTNTQVYKNKITIGYNKFFYNDPQHGFVRVSVPFSSSGPDEARIVATNFIKAFYPLFMKYVSQPTLTR